MARHVEDGPQRDSINEGNTFAENKSTNASGYSGQTHKDVSHLICEGLEKNEERRIGRHNDNRCEKVVYVLSEQDVDLHVEDEPQGEIINKENTFSENESTNESGYSGPTHKDVCRLIREALARHEERRLGHSSDNRCEKIVLALFREADERAKGNVYTPVLEVVK